MKSIFKKAGSLVQLLTILVGFGLYVPLVSAAEFSNLSVDHNPFNPFDPSANTTTLTYTLTTAGPTNVNVQLFAADDMSKSLRNWTYANQASGTYNQPTWDGKDNAAKVVANGSYIFMLTGNSGGTDLPVQQISLKVQYASVSNLNVSPATFDPTKGSETLSYSLNTPGGTSDITVGVYPSANLTAPVKTWNYTGQTSGQYTVNWDGKDNSNTTVADGSYTFMVGGTSYDGGIIQSQKKNFAVQTVTPTPTPTPNPTPTPVPPTPNCAGFTDVSAGDPNCAAITYVKTIGAMTGNPNGTFGPNDLLQRDQIAKISLETFKKFDKTLDYCNGKNPFPDVTPNDWAYQYICRGKQLGMITGYIGGIDAGFYRPARNVNRVEFLALILRNLSEAMPTVFSPNYNDVPLDQWFTPFAKYSYDNNLFVKPNLLPTSMTMRVEVAATLYQLHNLGKL